ncbi:MAG TPA: TIR domain-containing protein, partial [Chloroflexota bacterium]|nr:TIR domain-containing protein [Chloroflexota bacterium]
MYAAHAQADDAILEHLRTDLRQHGVTVWMDEHDLLPGTPDWEQALREAIRASLALLLIASPHTRSSRYVADELRIAELYGRRVYPVWVEGEQWMDCVPLGWGGLQYLDARGERATLAVAALAKEVQRLRDRYAGIAGPAATLTTPAFEPRNPYKGLRAFTGADAGDFFGRDRLVDELVATLAARAGTIPRFLALVGASGSGKSSVVLAGLLPRLQAGALPGSAEWIYLEPLVPGTRPLHALAGTLSLALAAAVAPIRDELEDSPDALHRLARRLARRPEQRVVLVVDQCEELFSPAVDEGERRCAIDLLVTAATAPDGPLLVLLTLRADFYDRPLRYPALGALLHTHSTVVLPLTTADLRQAIAGPAALPDVQVTFDEDLIGDLLFDLREQAGALPLLQFTLDQLFARREGQRLTWEAYRALGGVRGALARHAEATYGALPSKEHRVLARALFLRLIDPGATEQDTTRRRAPMAEFALPDREQTARLQEAADAFIAARLLVVTRPPTGPVGATETTLEVSHEALIREWERLGEWLHETREDVRRQQAISADAAAWEQRERPADHLYRGSLLLEAEAWAARNTPSAREVAFLDAARLERDLHALEERERQTRQLALTRQSATRLRALVGILALSLIVAAALSAFAITSALQARQA